MLVDVNKIALLSNKNCIQEEKKNSFQNFNENQIAFNRKMMFLHLFRFNISLF